MVRHDLDVVVTRGKTVESCHRVHAAAVDRDDALVGVARNASFRTPWRSCAKPFQIMPLIEAGGFDALGWGDEELAIACASHGGEPEHLAIVDRMLDSLGLEEGDLACGPHEPLTARGARIARESGERITRKHNNCSGKHAAMLALARHMGWPIAGYERAEHPAQQAMLNMISRWTGARRSQITVAVDGCGAAVFGLSLELMARAYARLGNAARKGEEIPRRIVDAMGRHPHLIGGSDRVDTVVIAETRGSVLAKIGAEGVHSAVILERGVGIAIKVEDGNPRAQSPALIQVLADHGAFGDVIPPKLSELLGRPVRNSRGDVVGETRISTSGSRRRPGAVAAAV